MRLKGVDRFGTSHDFRHQLRIVRCVIHTHTHVCIHTCTHAHVHDLQATFSPLSVTYTDILASLYLDHSPKEASLRGWP